ncbi:twin-arginine translocase TatA/TatE family subunit [Streptomyces sp. NPDC005438]|uniref:twin-arginine translocase TatA/TatE family subunit n=1 Tax=Streptomyces sp. NPDC005438 TaxID=3156880 RepID=UPI0033A471D6
MFGLGELAVLLLVVIAVLAVKRLPGLTRSAGEATRLFKKEKRAPVEEAPVVVDDDGAQVVRGEVLGRDTTQS